MNTTQTSTVNGTNQNVYSAVRAVLLYISALNNGASAVMMRFVDESSAPPLGGQSSMAQYSGISKIVEAGATWTFPVDAATGVAMTNGIVFQSFALDANRSPVMTATSGTCNVRCDWAALQ
jgi:hypothetical protein